MLATLLLTAVVYEEDKYRGPSEEEEYVIFLGIYTLYKKHIDQLIKYEESLTNNTIPWLLEAF